MGSAALAELIKINEIDKLRLLVLKGDKRIKRILKKYRSYRQKIEVIYGNIADYSVCEKLADGADYVINMCAVIPPHSDHNPQASIDCNQTGVKNLVTAIEKAKKQPKLIHISTVALYGNRNSKHLYGRVGDPLLVSPYDIYAITKMRGEFYVLESDIKDFVVLRQTAMLHHNIMSDNISDGLMFHTCFNAPLEWVTDNDSGVLIAQIIKKDIEGGLGGNFWRRCFNIGGGKINQKTGFDVLNEGFKLIGGSTKDFFGPDFNALRNFHGVWFEDGCLLNDLFGYQKQSTLDLWREIKSRNKYMSLGKIVPKKLIKKAVIERKFTNTNSPRYWIKKGDGARVFAYFGGEEKVKAMPAKWADFPLLIENKDEDGNAISYEKLCAEPILTDLGIDIDKDGFTAAELRTYAEMHGGELLSESVGGMYDKLKWRNSDGEIFEARVYTVVKAGHWLNVSYRENVWDFDRLAKKDKIYSQIWYDSHGTDENKRYSFTEDFKAVIENI